jgi:ATP-dependent DNA helicase RecG
LQIISLSQDEVAKIFVKQESHFFDFKSSSIAPGKLTKSISGFANAEGGEIIVGIQESTRDGSKVWQGFESVEHANAILQAVYSVLPLGEGCHATFLQSTDHQGLLLQLEVEKNRQIIRTTAGEVYVRRGAQNLPVQTEEAMQRLEYAKGITSFETNTVNLPVSFLTNSEAIIRFMLEVVPHQEPESWLRKEVLVVGDKPTVAGIILFSDVPQALLPKKCGIKIYRYRTIDDEGTREALVGTPETVEGCAYDQIYKAVAVTTGIIAEIPRMTSAGLEAVQYPHETLHEIITNAVLHRDYSIPDDIHIRIYDNRVEVESPGALPGHISRDNILRERFARNGAIQRMVNKFPNPPNKDVGEGLNTAFRAMQQLQLREPDIRPLDSKVIVVIKHEKLGSPEKLIMEYLACNDKISNGIAREICFIREDWRIRNIFAKMVEAGMIEKIEGSNTSNTAYKAVRTSK